MLIFQKYRSHALLAISLMRVIGQAREE